MRSGRVGRLTRSPPQFGQAPPSRPFAQSAQNVHSKVQISASDAPFGRSLSQHSQLGRRSSMALLLRRQVTAFQMRLEGRRAQGRAGRLVRIVSVSAIDPLLCTLVRSQPSNGAKSPLPIDPTGPAPPCAPPRRAAPPPARPGCRSGNSPRRRPASGCPAGSRARSLGGTMPEQFLHAGVPGAGQLGQREVARQDRALEP